MKKLHKLQPQPLWNYFEAICRVPRPSKKEGQIRQFLLDFAAENNLDAETDQIGNVLIRKPAAPGKEEVPAVILQAHMDMVCEKNSDKVFNFETDAIVPVVAGDWVTADGTTLGADDGIGIAAQLAVLTSREMVHGPIECLITVDEETGLSGASALQAGFLTGKILINLDSEDDGELFIGCAGGIDTIGTLTVEQEKTPGNSSALKIMVKGLMGGHSGDDIHKGRGNANKILTRFLWRAVRQFGLRIADFDGGNLRNAIAREASATVIVPHVQKGQLLTEINLFSAEVEFEYERTEPNLVVDQSATVMPVRVLTQASQDKLLNMLYACPHGVLEMSTRMEHMVETSTNLASVKFTDEEHVVVTTSQRSEVESRKYFASEMVRSVFELAGAEVRTSDGYPGWIPNPSSKILKIAVDSYVKLFGEKPVVRSIHAGLECGLFLEKYPDLDMVSIGPTIRGAHSPDERINIRTVNKFWLHLTDMLKNISLLLFLLFIVCSCSNGPDENWTHFRGTKLDGISVSKDAPRHWSETENISWKTPVKGMGWSSPVVYGTQVWLTTADKSGEWFSAICIDFESGKMIKDIELFRPDSVQRIHSTNSYATSTPCIEAGYVYVHYGTYGTACIDTKSFKTIWSRTDLNCEHLQGAASSLVLYKNLLIVHLEGTDVQNIFALNKHTGEIVWQVGTPDKKVYEEVAPVFRKSYQTPLIVTIGGKDQLITNRSLYAVSYDPDTGAENWRFYYGEDSAVSMPLFYKGLVLVNSGWVLSQGAPYFAQLFAIDPKGSGDVTDSHMVWKTSENVPQTSTPVIVDSLMFMVEERGTMSCLNPENGTVYWKEKLKGNFNISPVFAGGNVYFTTVKGETTIIKAAPVYEKVAENSLKGIFKASPAILRNAILQRSDRYLYKIEAAED